MGARLNYVGCAGDMAHVFNLIALIFLLVAVSTPAWVDQVLEVPVMGDVVFGRGFFQSYEYDNNGIIFLFNHIEEDRDGNKMDPFCGSANATLISTALTDAGVVRTRDNDTSNWCMNRDAAAAFALLATIFSLCSFATSLALQRGFCSMSMFVIFCAISAFCAFINSTIVGGFIEDEKQHVSKQAEAERLFPFKQTIVVGYSFALAMVAMALMMVAALLACCECCKKHDDVKVEAAEA
eukprot:TRINITY_DN653_c0_g1_i1.p2 TRINITY_DN653_c0_g1~~TRINITY_DN653_c0_g1_i1.p2  ORF type:complete len:238 (+),score=55.32 TRINITY_DN653_c0_g1_i1:2023-2736(+)